MRKFNLVMSEDQVDHVLTYIESMLDQNLEPHEREFYEEFMKEVSEQCTSQVQPDYNN